MKVFYPGDAGAVRGLWFYGTVVNSEFLEIGDDTDAQIGAPAVKANLVSDCHIFFNHHTRFFGFYEEKSFTPRQTGKLIKCFGGFTNLNPVLMNHFAVGFCKPLRIISIPAKRFE